MSTRTYLSIGDVLSLLRQEFPDITISKIRFLESQGLVNPERSPSGYRKFYEHDVERLRWVLRQQREHFLPLKVIRDRLASNGVRAMTSTTARSRRPARSSMTSRNCTRRVGGRPSLPTPSSSNDPSNAEPSAPRPDFDARSTTRDRDAEEPDDDRRAAPGRSRRAARHW